MKKRSPYIQKISQKPRNTNTKENFLKNNAHKADIPPNVQMMSKARKNSEMNALVIEEIGRALHLNSNP